MILKIAKRLFSGISSLAYTAAAIVAAVVFGAAFGWLRRGRADDLTQALDRLEALKEANRVQQEVQSYDDPYLAERAREWVRKDDSR